MPSFALPYGMSRSVQQIKKNTLTATSTSRAPESRSHMPVPLRLTVCGLPGSLSLMTRVADRAPAALGLNARLIVHNSPPATVLPAAQVELD